MLDDNAVEPVLIDHLIFQQNAVFIIQKEVWFINFKKYDIIGGEA
jgi:hypothetical protein